MKKFIILITIILSVSSLHAATVDTVSIYSSTMKKGLKAVVVTPANYKKDMSYPVVYLLHGSGGWYSNMIIRIPQLKEYADEYGMILVFPDGGKTNWYFDSPINDSFRYETYISKEVPAFIDAHYNTIKDRKGRAIAGLSMGGHGALFLGFRHADFFGACGSMSGAVDLMNLPGKKDVAKLLGDSTAYPDNWKNYSVITVVEKYPKDSLAIIIDCGTEDFLYKGNVALHAKLLQLKIPHDYIERNGKHEWPYWRNAVQYQLLFFNNYFKGRK